MSTLPLPIVQPPPEPAPDWGELRRPELERKLRRHVDGEVRFAEADRRLYATDASHYRIPPLGVVLPRTAEGLRSAVQVIAEHRVPIVPRGGGTSLSGQSVGAGVVIDTSKHLHRILDLDAKGRRVRVEPGVVLDRLNRHLAPSGLTFGPDVSTLDRATMGGMIANNSAGSRSVKYGTTAMHLLATQVVLSDGTFATLEPKAPGQLATLLRKAGVEGDAYRTAQQIAVECADEIRARFPDLLRKVSGYALDSLLAQGPLNLAKLIAGSEGTLALVASADLNVEPLPTARGIACVSFAGLTKALEAVPHILATSPSATELIDRMILDLARGSAEYRGRVAFLDRGVQAFLLVEFSEDSAAAVRGGFDRLRTALAATAGTLEIVTADAAQCERLWALRKIALPLLMTLPGSRKPVSFVEDTAVAVEKLPRFVERFHEILADHRTTGSFYGHASVGCLHIRPLLDLHEVRGREEMASIAGAVVELVREFGGCLSGEHGDGLARSRFNRAMFGETVYDAFRRVKHAFDPDGILNPGKVVDGPPITDSLRPAARPTPADAVAFHYEEAGRLGEVMGRCNGNGVCRKLDRGVMCPSYQVLREEAHSPRGRANLVRASLESGAADWADKPLGDALDLCLSCKACKSECPSAVDIGKAKAEYLNRRHARHGPSLLERALADLPRHQPTGSRFAPLSNWLLRSWPVRQFLHYGLGVHRDRRLPAYARRTLIDRFRARVPAPGGRGRVLLHADCFTTYHQPQVGVAAVDLLEAAGYRVVLAPFCCGRTLLSKGFLGEARALVQRGLERLLPYAEDGVPVLGLEPSCLLSLTDEWPDLAPGGVADMVADRAFLVENWLAERHAAGATDLTPPTGDPAPVLVHGHCHQKAAGKLPGSLDALRDLAGLAPETIDAGCCGMAGAFGYERSHHDLSRRIYAQRLGPAVAAAGVRPVLAPGFSCRCQIADLGHVAARHPVELIAERLLGRGKPGAEVAANRTNAEPRRDADRA